VSLVSVTGRVSYFASTPLKVSTTDSAVMCTERYTGRAPADADAAALTVFAALTAAWGVTGAL